MQYLRGTEAAAVARDGAAAMMTACWWARSVQAVMQPTGCRAAKCRHHDAQPPSLRLTLLDAGPFSSMHVSTGKLSERSAPVTGWVERTNVAVQKSQVGRLALLSLLDSPQSRAQVTHDAHHGRRCATCRRTNDA
jgi:hypothetical protein